MYLLLRFSVFIECIFEWNAPSVQFSSLQLLSRVRLFGTPWISGREASLSITNSRVHSNSHPSSRWSHPAISSSAVPFPSCPHSLPASESFPMSQLFTWGGQNTGVSALASFLPKNTAGVQLQHPGNQPEGVSCVCRRWCSLWLSTKLPVYFKPQVFFYTLTKALGQRFDIFSFPHPDLLSPEIIIILHTEFLLQWFSQNQLYYLLSTSSYVSYT